MPLLDFLPPEAPLRFAEVIQITLFHSLPVESLAFENRANLEWKMAPATREMQEPLP